MMDITISRLDGAYALRMMKKLKPEVPVITFTGQVGHDDKAGTVKLGAITCLPKPVTIDQLRGALNMIGRAAAGNRATAS